MADAEDLRAIIEPLARLLLGDPNPRVSTKSELRYGSRGSLSVDREKGTFFDHEAGQGGGALDLVSRETGLTGAERMRWLEDHGLLARPNGGDGRPHIVRAYPYQDEDGRLLFEVVRLEPKDFRQRRPDSTRPGGWDWSTRGVRPVPYRLPELTEALGLGKAVFIVEGEKDVDRLAALGVPATTNAGGAGKWRQELTEFFAGADVVIIPDHDPQRRHEKTGELMFHPDGRPKLPGQDHAAEVAEALSAVAKVRLLDLSAVWPDMPPKGDVSDWLDRGGGSVEALYELAERLPTWSPDDARDSPKPVKLASKTQFLEGFVPPDYLIDGILHRRFVYALTGQTGHAKTAIALLIAELVASTDANGMLGPHRAEKGQVAYFVGENPDELRMRLIGADAVRGGDPAQDRLFFAPGVFNIADMMATLREDCDRVGALDLVIVDTSAAYFLGADEISNTEMGKHARMLRALTTLPGSPCVLVLCHPIKHVAEPAQLLPRGGGAFLAEMDGNLTIWKHEDVLVELHHNKIRGPGFEPMIFRLDKFTTATLVDAKGRPLPTVRAVHVSQSDEDRQAQRARDDEDRVLARLLAFPDISMAEIAIGLGWTFKGGEAARSRVQRAIDRLKGEKPALIVKKRDKWTLTEKGKEAARIAVLRFERQAESDAQSRLFDP